MYKLKECQSGYYKMVHESGKECFVTLSKRQAYTILNNLQILGLVKVDFVSDSDPNKKD